ncbi:MAG: PspC domain-containing protein [Sphingomicrobium sp.]
MTAQDHNVALPVRSQTLLGVCEALGEDFGFNANFIRVPLGAIVVLNVGAAVAVYLGLGVIVLASRLLFPVPKATTGTAVRVPEPANSQVETRIAA